MVQKLEVILLHTEPIRGKVVGEISAELLPLIPFDLANFLTERKAICEAKKVGGNGVYHHGGSRGGQYFDRGVNNYTLYELPPEVWDFYNRSVNKS